MTIELTPELDRIVADKLSTGSYASANAVIAEALQLMKQHQDEALVEFQHELHERLEGPDRDVDLAPDEIWQKLAQRSRPQRDRLTA